MEMTNESKNNQVQLKEKSLNLSSQDKKVVIELLNNPLQFVPHDNFQLQVVMDEIMEQNINVLSGQSLKADEEKTLFMQYNYAR